MKHYYLACDLGAESGRIILGTLANGRVELEELHRFPTGAHRLGHSLRWNLFGIFTEIKAGLTKAAARNLPIEGISVDSWGVDYVLLRKDAPMLSLPHHYRDSRTDAIFERLMADPAQRALIFEETGIQYMQINTLVQLIAELEQNSALLALAERFLTIGDYINYLLCGEAKIEESLASTTQLYNPRSRDWSQHLIERYRLPAELFPPVVPSGTPLGPILPEVAGETGLSKDVSVIATCSHDTGCAVAAVPAHGDNWAYLSSGTWSLLGVELQEPLINEEARAANFTNELGICGTVRFLKNTAGLWILQESRRAWAAKGDVYDYSELNEMAASARPFCSLIDPNDPRFIKPDAMPEKIDSFCRETGQPIPDSPAAYVRAILESLALLYRQNLETISRLTGRTLSQLHIVGGGSKSRLLNQFAANATGLTVLAGPVEATAVGNVLVQALALGHLDSVTELRNVVAASFKPERFTPCDADQWNAAYTRFSQF